MTQSAPALQNAPVFRQWKKYLLATLVFFTFSLALQHLDGAYQNEFGGHPDEAAHYVTGLMVRDYLASGFHTGPMAFAQNYYDHYPKVALGNWPPLFYLAQAAWTLLVPPTRAALLCFMAMLAALAGAALFGLLQAEFGFPQALLGTLLFLSLPLVQLQTGMLMAEIPVTLLALVATIFFGRFLAGKRALDSAAFGFFASLAIMTKGNGLLLGLVPPLALLFTRRFSVLKLPAFWIPALIVPILCGPWLLKFRDATRAGWEEPHPSWHFTREAVQYYPAKLVLAVGFVLAALAAVGFVTRLLLRQNSAGAPAQISNGEARWAAAGALLCATLIFQFIVPCGREARHLLPALPPLILFIFAGGNFIIRWLNQLGLSPKTAAGLTLAITGVAFFGQTWRLKDNDFLGFAPVAQRLLADPEASQSVFLVSSDSLGEGAFISEIAMHEQRPGHVVRRVSKALASSTWSGGDYKPRFADESALLAFLQKSAIGYLVMDDSLTGTARKSHHELLHQTVVRHPEIFALEASYPIDRRGVWQTNGIQLYKLKW